MQNKVYNVFIDKFLCCYLYKIVKKHFLRNRILMNKKTKRKLKSLVRIIFGRTLIVVLGLALQVAFVLTALIYFSSHYVFFSAAMSVMSLIALVCIINDKTNPYYKLAWVVPVMLVPIFGTVLYIFVRLELGTRIMNKRIIELIGKTAPFIPQDENVLAELETVSAKEKNLAVYMKKYAGFPVFRSTGAEYFPLGEDAFHAIVRELEKAEKFIFLEFFIVEHGEMWDAILEILERKSKQGVDVRFMYDGMSSLVLVPYNYPKKLAARGIKCKVFSPIKPVLTTIQNNRDHRKILVIDGHTAFTGGINLADEYINKFERFGHWKDTAVMVKGDAAKSFTAMFLQNWNISEKSEDDYAVYTTHIRHDFPLEEGFVLPYGDSPLDNENVGKNVYLDILDRAERYVHIMTPYLILDEEMSRALTFAAKRGVDVSIIMPHIPDKQYAYILARSYYGELISAGVKIYEYTPGFIHAKEFVSDDVTAVVGSINLDYRSLFLHFECACRFYRCEVVRDVEADMLATMKKCCLITLDDCRKYNIFKKLIGRILRVFAPLM